MVELTMDDLRVLVLEDVLSRILRCLLRRNKVRWMR